MRDFLPVEKARREHVLSVIRSTFRAHGFDEIETPVVEDSERLHSGLGGDNEKLSYAVMKRELGAEQLAAAAASGDPLELADLGLRFDLTVPLARYYASHRAELPKVFRSIQIGPVWRAERPQKGRYRQFYQLDVEAIGFAGPDVDAELIALSARLWRRLELSGIRLEINSLGTSEARRAYREILVAYFRRHESALDADSRRRLEGNPLRILDSKNPQMAEVIAGAPLLTDHLDEPSRTHFAELAAALDRLGIAYRVNPRLVRGLDYYSRTVFEWLTDALGAQDAVCSGGRYDGLIAQLGGEPTPAVGFALGIERVVDLLVQAARVPAPVAADVYVIVNGAQSGAALQMTEELRDALPHRRFEFNLGGGNFKAQFRRADKSGAVLALVCGDAELARGVVAMKPLREEAGQTECPQSELAARLEELLVRLTSRPSG
jgi:histidyl-tRNA synthetase